MNKLPPDKEKQQQQQQQPLQKEQQGGTYLGEGADGCIFEAPGNWPCEKALKGYSPSDKSLVTKIVPTSDIEGDILKVIKSIQKRHSEHYNLVRFIGECKPKLIFDKQSNPSGKPQLKLSGFTKTHKNYYTKHLRQMAKTEKACKQFKDNLNSGKVKSSDYKMYVIGKYEKSYKEFCQDLEFRFYSKDKIADIIYDGHLPFLKTLETLINDSMYTVVNFDLHSKNIVVFKNPHKDKSKKKVEKGNGLEKGKEFEIGVADFGRSIWRKKSESYSFQTFLHWDQPYIESFLTRDSKENAGETFSKYNQFSMEGRLINYILTNLNRKASKDTLWIERMYESEYVKKILKDKDIYDILLFYLPSFIKSVSGSKRYKKYEEGIELCVRALADQTPENQFLILGSNPNLRTFWDLLKTRSHLPTALGVYFMRGIRAANYTRKEIQTIIEEPQQTKIYVPEKFRLLLFKYVNYMMLPFTDI